MEVLHRNSNIRLIFFTLIFTSLIFILQNESLADRDAYLSWIKNIEMITDSSHNGSKLIYFIAEPLWNYLLQKEPIYHFSDLVHKLDII